MAGTVLLAAGYSCIPSCQLQLQPCRRLPPALESTGTPLGALELLIVSGSGAMETRSVPGLPAFLAQQRLLAEAGPLNSSIDTVSRKVKSAPASP